MTQRGLVLKLLLRLDEDGGYSNILLDNELQKQNLDNMQRAFATTLFYGVIERRITLDYYISRLSKTKIQKLSKTILNILRMGIYQIKFMDSVPDSAAVNESVILAKKSASPRSSGFVNGVLRSFIRNKDSIKLPDDRLDRMSVLYSCPKPLISKLCLEYGDENAESFLINSLMPAKVFIRVNTLKTDAKMLAAMLEDEGVRAQRCDFDENALIVSGKIFSTSPFSNGLFYAQDYSSQLAAKHLGAKSGERILDICSAPGGKAFTTALEMNGVGEIVACDIYKHKVSLIKDGANRLGIDIINARVNDASVYNKSLGEFDRVLCDVPCSGFGIIKRKPEIKYKPLEKIKDLPQIQMNILKTSSLYLKPGGVLIYSTCTLNRAENEDVIGDFLKSNSDFEAINEFDGGYTKTIMPENFGSDAFFISKIRRRNKW